VIINIDIATKACQQLYQVEQVEEILPTLENEYIFL
jgi:hypothetical protein